MRITRAIPIVLLLSGALGLPAQAQDVQVEVPLEEFVREVVQLWLSADVTAIVSLMQESDRLVLDTGTGIENANSRHAAAALRALFAESETVGTRAVRVTVASARPPHGFRARGSPGEQARSIYVAAAWEGDGWKITELRLMP